MTELDELQGIWRRSFIRQPDGAYDDTTRVTWMQGVSLYADLRQPLTNVSFAGVKSLRGLEWLQVSALACQEGFAGVLVQHNDHFEWTRLIDFQPPQVVGDRGVLEFIGDSLIEEGYEIPYVEHWRREPRVNAPAATLQLRDVESGCLAIIVRVADRFMFARGRASGPHRSGRLADHVNAALSLESAQDLIDCEVSAGVVSAEWRIDASTLPFRVNAKLAPRFDRARLQTSDVTPEAADTTRTWEILLEEGDRKLMASATPTD